ncbi:MAG: PCRF domain-containing protein, partial [Patescibacteria group bacterium]
MEDYGGIFDPAGLTARNQQLEKEMVEPSFWQDQEKVQVATREFDKNKKLIAEIEDLDSKLGSLALVMKDEDFSSTDGAATVLLTEVQQRLDQLEIATILNGPYDRMDAYLSLHSGTGGVDAADWTQMLRDMYLKYAARRGWKTTIIDFTPGGEAGIKSATIKIEGDLAYGLL